MSTKCRHDLLADRAKFMHEIRHPHDRLVPITLQCKRCTHTETYPRPRRNPAAKALQQKRPVSMKDRRAERGGAKNRQRAFHEENE